MDDLAKLLTDQALAMNQTMMNGYEAGLAEGFRRGVQAAADYIAYNEIDGAEESRGRDVHLSRIIDAIRALRPEGGKP